MSQAQKKANEQYKDLCAAYADLGFKIEALKEQQEQVRHNIEALNASVPFILAVEHESKLEAAAVKTDAQAPTPIAQGTTTVLPRVAADMNGSQPKHLPK